MSELEYFLSVENIEISLYAQARQSLLLLTQGNINNRLRFLNKCLMFLEELNELFREHWSKFRTAGFLVWKTVSGCRISIQTLTFGRPTTIKPWRFPFKKVDSCVRAGYTIAYHVSNSFTDITFNCV